MALAKSTTPEPTYNETVSGYTFLKSGPKHLKSKAEYEAEFTQTALRILKENLGADYPPEPVDLFKLKESLGADKLISKAVNRASTGTWKDASGRAIAFLPELTAARFALWSQSPFADAANNAANAEHYVKRTRNLNGTLESEILEGWGGITTHFHIPNYAPPNPADPDRQFLNKLPDYPYQGSGDKVLMDGEVFGVLHISVKDVKGAEFGSALDGVEIFASVWYGDGVQDEHLEVEVQHITVEIINLTLQASRDIVSGAFKPSV
ncbi:hypothetical protein BDV95DRAFT_496658 [Massariosphaeria phaeospora]|uniref:Uncharacterized protein n=1 Tax=Massariosphaeria phaeospora TaxID=100035 RepID=A0A7C8M4S5_9PLEO|nr:hypothetical protein BDV95DRAFT_496658 [Massariosphaeria phaeospora]